MPGGGEVEKPEEAYEAALHYLSYRPRSSREVRQYLEDKGYDVEVLQLVLSRLEQAGLVNDREFARAWVDERNRLRPRSRGVLRQELRAKGITWAVIEETLADTGADEVEVAVRLVAKRARLSQYDDRGKLAAYLQRKGFDYAVIKKALQRLDDVDQLSVGSD